MNEEFIVKESTLINSIFLVFFFLVFFGVILTLSNDGENSISVYLKPLLLLVMILIIGIKKFISKKVVYRVNSEGLYYYDKIICDWNNFYCAFGADDSDSAEITDKIKLVVQFFNEKSVLMEQRLPFPQNLDKSTSEIIEAINKFKTK